MPVVKTGRITPSNPSTAVVDLQLRAVALCAEGANSRADIILAKRKENEAMPTPKTFEELLKSLQPEVAQILQKHIEGIQAKAADDCAKLNSQVEELSKKVTELEKERPAAAAEQPTDVLKGVSPEVAELFKKQQNMIDGLLADRAEALAKARFEKCKAIPADETSLKEVLKTASPAVVDILEKAAAAIVEKTHTPEGTTGNPQFVGTSANDLYGQLEKSAKDIMKSNSGMTFEAAFTEACNRDPETYRKYTEGV